MSLSFSGSLAFVIMVVGSSFLQAQTTGAVTGAVFEADRPQPGLEVVLTDKDGKTVAKAKTTEKGTFEFKDVPAGSYMVTSSKPSTGRKGSAKADVVAGKTAEVKINLLL